MFWNLDLISDIESPIRIRCIPTVYLSVCLTYAGTANPMSPGLKSLVNVYKDVRGCIRQFILMNLSCHEILQNFFYRSVNIQECLVTSTLPPAPPLNRLSTHGW